MNRTRRDVERAAIAFLRRLVDPAPFESLDDFQREARLLLDEHRGAQTEGGDDLPTQAPWPPSVLPVEKST